MIGNRLKTVILVLLTVFFSFSCAYGAEQDISKLIFKDALFVLKMNAGALISQSQSFESQIPSLKKAQEEIQAEIEKRTGLSVKRDVKNFIASIGPEVNFNDKKPNNVLIALTGSFNAEKLAAEIAKEKKIKVSVEKKNGMTALVAENGFQGLFLNETTLVFGSSDAVESLAAGKFNAGELSGALKKYFDESNFFFSLSLNQKMKDDILKNMRGGVPPIASILLKSLVSLSAFDSYPALVLKADFSEKNAAEDFKKLIDSFKNMADIMISAKEKEEDEKISRANAFELLKPELIGMKMAIAAGKTLLGSIALTVDGSCAELKFTVPEEFREMLKPEQLPILAAGAGILAAIAIPNFTKARTKAQEKACIANMRTIEGACELYKMDNNSPATLTVDDLAKKEYLKSAPVCPSEKARRGLYKIIINDEGFDVECPSHGKLSNFNR